MSIAASGANSNKTPPLNGVPTRPSSILAGMVWKETRQLAVFAIAMLLLGGILQLVIAQIVSWPNVFNANQARLMSIGVIGIFCQLFGAAVGATLFATEKEEGTFQSLQFLPTAPGQIAKCKIIAALLLCTTFFVVAMLIGFVSLLTTGQTGQWDWATTFLLMFGLGTIEFFAWAWLCSVLTSRPLNAALIGIFLASVGIQLAVISGAERHSDFASAEPYLQSWKLRAIIAVVALLAAWTVSAKWLHRSEKVSRNSTGRPGTIASSLTHSIRNTNALAQLGRLSWQSVRQSWKSVLFLFLVPIAFLAITAILSQDLFLAVLPLVLCAGGMAGLAAFSADQRVDSRKFLATRGVSAFQIWLSRVLPWTLAIIALFVVGYAGFLIWATAWGGQSFSAILSDVLWPSESRLGQNLHFYIGGYLLVQVLSYCCLGTLLCFAIGQFASNMIRSRILAFVNTVIGCVIAIGWMALMMLGAVPLWWSVLPMILVACVAGWMALKANLGEASAVQRIAIPSTLVAVTAGLLLVTTINHRVNEIPDVQPMFPSQPKADMAIIDEIETQLHEVLAQIAHQENKQVIPYTEFQTLLEMSELPEFESFDLNDFANYQGNETIQLNVENAIRMGNNTSLSEQLAMIQEWLQANADQIDQIKSALQFAWENQQELERLDPGALIRSDNPSPFIGRSEIVELLSLGFYKALHEDDPDEAWSNLLGLVQARKLFAFAHSNGAHWYSGLFGMLEDWTLCESQTPELLRKGLNVVLKEMVPLDQERVLKSQYLGLLRSIDNRSSRNGNDYPFLLDAVSHTNWEKERSRRLVSLQCDWKLKQLGQTPERFARYLVKDGNEPAILNSWELPNTETDYYAEDRRNNINPPRLGFAAENAAKKAREEFNESRNRFSQTSFIPGINWDDGYFSALSWKSRDYDINRYDEYFFDRRKMLALQMHLVLHRLKHGELPRTLIEYEDLVPNRKTNYKNRHGHFTGIPGVQYYPYGTKHHLHLDSLKRFNSDVGSVPPETPFITNAPIVFGHGYDYSSWPLGTESMTDYEAWEAKLKPVPLPGSWAKLVDPIGFPPGSSIGQNPIFLLLAKPKPQSKTKEPNEMPKQ